MSLNDNEIARRVGYRAPTSEAARRHQVIRQAIGSAMVTVVRAVPTCREQSLAVTKLEEALFWANAGVARNHAGLELGPAVAGTEPEAPRHGVACNVTLGISGGCNCGTIPDESPPSPEGWPS